MTGPMKLHRTSLTLAIKYLAIIMLISGLFSVNMYVASVHEIGRGYGRLGAGLNRAVDSERLLEFRETQLALSRQALKNRLIAINALILILGGVASYYLARKTLEPIEAAHEAQNRFTSDASHELRTPITAIRSENEAFLLSPRANIDEAKDIMHSTIEELDKLTALIDGLLRLARSSEENFNPSEVALNELIESSTHRLRDAAKAKNITIHINNDDEALPVVVDIELMSDAIKLLLDNAIKYSSDSKNIYISAYKEKDSLSIAVKDEGPGIKQSHLPHIFERFYQGDTSRNKATSSGLGIGLSIVKSIVDIHNGVVTVQSELGQGTTFSIRVPQ